MSQFFVLYISTQVANAIGAQIISSNSSYSILTLLTEATSALLPKIESEIPSFKASLERPFKDFDEKLQLFLFVDESQSGKLQKLQSNQLSLSSYLVDLVARYAEIRRRETLERARELVLSDYHNTMIAGGDALDGTLFKSLF